MQLFDQIRLNILICFVANFDIYYTCMFTVVMLSPKMQRCVRVVDNQLLMLSDRARTDSTLTGNLHKKASDSGRWKNRYFVLYQVCYIELDLVKNSLAVVCYDKTILLRVPKYCQVIAILILINYSTSYIINLMIIPNVI